MKPRSPIARLGKRKLEKVGGRKVYSTISAPKKAVRKSNPVATAKRKKGYRKMLAGKEYKAARAEAMQRAGNCCEWSWWNPTDRNFYDCRSISGLHAHHLRYPKSRPLTADDLQILCKRHHEMAEAAKMHKTRMF